MNSILKIAVFLLWFGLLMGLVGALVYLIPNWNPGASCFCNDFLDFKWCHDCCFEGLVIGVRRTQ